LCIASCTLVPSEFQKLSCFIHNSVIINFPLGKGTMGA
jgi:hypothetical protein